MSTLVTDCPKTTEADTKKEKRATVSTMHFEQHRWTRDELSLYEYWKNKEWIHLHALNESAEKAREAGKAEGEAQKAHHIACALIREGFADDMIGKTTGLTLDTIRTLRTDMTIL